MPAVVSSDQVIALRWSVCRLQPTVDVAARGSNYYARLAAKPHRVYIYGPREYDRFINHMLHGTFPFA